MSRYRIEITFSGEAPDDELSRARILANPDVATAEAAYSKALADAGFAHTVTARSIAKVDRKKKARPLAAAAE